jgi:aspartate/methionine/tyrosine aminotransferase
MAGWRVGMLMGAAKHIQNVIKVKSNMDSGMFYGIQKGAMKALSVSDQWFDDLNEIYKSRRTLIWELATKLNCTYNQEAAGMFVWAKLPSETDAETFIDNLLHKHHIFIAPGTIFGSNGSGYIRFSLCANSSTIQDAINRIV